METVPCVLNIPEFKTELAAEATNDPDVIVKVNELRSKIPFVLMVKDDDGEIVILLNNVMSALESIIIVVPVKVPAPVIFETESSLKFEVIELLFVKAGPLKTSSELAPEIVPLFTMLP